MMSGARGTVALVVALLAGCSDSAPTPVVQKVSPNRGYTDRDLRIVIDGTGFLPSYRVDPATGRRIGLDGDFSGQIGAGDVSVPLREFGWRGPTQLSATAAKGLPAGIYPVSVTDPRGQTTVLENAFTALGPDSVTPRIAFESPAPDSLVAPGMNLPVRLSARDEEPGRLLIVFWELGGPGDTLLAQGECPIGPKADATTCSFEMMVPGILQEGDIVTIRAVALDEAATPNQSEAKILFHLRPRPLVVDLTPSFGGTAGGTDVLVRGSGFTSGAQVLFGRLPLIPNGGVVLNAQTISGRAPPMPPGPQVVMVHGPTGDAVLPDGFEYRAPPHIDGVDPLMGSAAGGTAVRIWGESFTTNTRIYFGSGLGRALAATGLQYASDKELTGHAPPGMGQTSVWAFDPDLGWSRLAGTFTWVQP